MTTNASARCGLVLGWIVAGSVALKAAEPPAPGQAAPHAAAATQQAGPKYVCDEESFDFGTVWAGERIEHVFLVRNDGNEDLKILEFKPTCSCTLTPNYQRVIKPGETGRLHAILTTDKQRDKIVKALEVYTNEPGGGEKGVKHVLKITGFVKTVVKLTPVGANFFRRITPDFTQTNEITLTNTAGQPLKLELLPPKNRSPFKTTLKETIPGQEYRVSVTAEPPYREGTNSTTLEFKTNIPQSPKYEIVVSAYLPPEVEISPPRMLVDGNQRVDQQRRLTIRNNTGKTFDVIDIAGSDARFQPRLVNKSAGVFTFEVTIPAFYRPPPGGEHVVIRTTDPQRQQIRVQILPHGVPPPKEIVDEARRRAASTPTPGSASVPPGK